MSGCKAGTPLLAIVGPTAVGKSTLALRLAGVLGGEIVNADSRQVYRFMDIGTAKPSPQERAVVPHHLVDIITPDQEFSLALFLRLAGEAIQDIASRGKLPVLVGGTGQYVWGLLEGWQVPEVPPDPELRRALEARARAGGAAALYEELARLDPQAASRIDPRNVRRVVRALEVLHASPDRLPSPPRKAAPPYRAVVLGLTLERGELYRRIDQRVDDMVARGWVAEVERLLAMGYSPALPAMSGIGYKELVQHLRGELSLEEAVRRTKHRTHRFVRHQYAWFRLDDPRVRWHQATPAGLAAAEEEARRALGGCAAPG